MTHLADRHPGAPSGSFHTCTDRRALLAGGGLLGIGLAMSSSAQKAATALFPSLGQAPSHVRTGRRVDVHHHPVPPAYAAAAQIAGPLRGWSVQKALDDMDAAGVATAMLSLPAAGLWPRDLAANRRTARACNDFMAQMASDHPGRFGVFAALPLGDVAGSLAEAAYALDVLRADGIGLFTSYHDRWLGDAAFVPVFEELDRRHALVYTHPTTADCCVQTVPGVSPATIEYGTDTTRAIAHWLFGGNGQRFRDLKLIFSHAGGTMPFLIQRFEQEARTAAHAPTLPDGVLPMLRRYFYDTAQAANPVALGALLQIVPPSQILLGTDFPYARATQAVAGLYGSHLSPDILHAIDRGNALRLFPHLGADKR